MRTLLALSFILFSLSANAETRYVTDDLEIQLRSGPSTQYRILRSLPSGTALELSNEPITDGFQKVTFGQIEGWVSSQYLMNTPGAKQKLAKVEAELAKLKASATPTQNSLLMFESENEDLKTHISALETSLAERESELDHIKKVSSQAIELDEQNGRLLLENSNLSNEIDLLRIENNRLKDQGNRDEIIYGALAVLLGVIIALVVPHMTVKKRKSDWF